MRWLGLCGACTKVTVSKKYPIYRAHDVFQKKMVRLCGRCRKKPIAELKNVVWGDKSGPRFTVDAEMSRYYIVDGEGNNGRGRAIAVSECLSDARFIRNRLNESEERDK